MINITCQENFSFFHSALFSLNLAQIQNLALLGEQDTFLTYCGKLGPDWPCDF